MSAHLKQLCHTHLPGNKEDSPAEHFKKMAQWCEDNDVSHDVYGEGETIQAFEQKVADLLGYEAGLFVVSGTMTQPTVLELVTKQKRNPVVAMHPSSHIYVHERQGYQLQNRFNILPIGNAFQTWKLNDLKAWPDEIAAVLYELPMREIGGQLPSWDELEKIKNYCSEKGIHLHMDGARLWEAAAYYQKDYSQIAKGFDTTYVSLYKGVNGLGGSMLLGSKAFIELASIWMKRQGGNLYHRTPYIVSAAMQFDEKLAKLPKLFERTKQIYDLISEFPELAANPTKPQSNMLHLILPFSYEEAVELQRTFATEKGIWLGNPQVTAHPNQSVIEWYVGDNLLDIEDDELRSFFTELLHGFK
ncbi:aminotransferase class I/II-fold pyridoxal phosphate-dependent enzyme [Vibrio sp. SCSIO 43135]|uniref:threonine aldolase family protein n=1 Tax=Vibrio sp. SCSIO 43135 TaxID=2819096 RepID=UPI0020761E2F|nr:beta-eliminating lyase-related protein [Vibrio sp. SCSIO 43135]USD42979.1 aminotransferase class I/II-fold pyridoxal phosphate-dependent enzyme [Vibrio sp. SCSIO 43135]